MTMLGQPLVNAVRNALAAHSWQAVPAPVLFIAGPIPPGLIALPACGVTVGEVDVAGGSLGSDGWLCALRVETVIARGLLTPEQQAAALIAVRDEVRGIMRQAVDGRWGLGEAVGPTESGAWRNWESAHGTAVEVMASIIIYDSLATAPPPPVKIHVQSRTLRAGGGKVSVLNAAFQPAATGIMAIQYRAYPSLAAIGIGRTTNDGNPVSQTVAQAVPAESQFVVDWTINATDGVFLDEPDVWRDGPWTMPPVGGTIDYPNM